MNDVTCGSAKKRNTVRSWLAKFGIPEEDEFFLLWNQAIIKYGNMIRRMESNSEMSDETVNMVEQILFACLYTMYDTSLEFLPQFKNSLQNLDKLEDTLCCMKRQEKEAGTEPDMDVDHEDA